MLTNGVAYTFRVAAVNTKGTGLVSSPDTPITIGTGAAPTAPLSPAATPGNGQVTLTWAAPAGNGSANISGYIVTPYIGGVAQPARAFNANATQVVTGLTNKQTYRFTVVASNAAGNSPPSAMTFPVTVGTPTAPVSVVSGPGEWPGDRVVDRAGVQQRTSSHGLRDHPVRWNARTTCDHRRCQHIEDDHGVDEHEDVHVPGCREERQRCRATVDAIERRHADVTDPRQYSPLITKYEPRIVPASFDFCRANLNEPSSAGISIPSESLKPTARFFGSSSGYNTLIESPLS